MESTTNHTPIYPDCEQTGMNSLGLVTVYLAPNKYPPPPSKPLLKQTPPGWYPPILVDGTHSSFLHTILRVWLAGLAAPASLFKCCQNPREPAQTGAELAILQNHLISSTRMMRPTPCQFFGPGANFTTSDRWRQDGAIQNMPYRTKLSSWGCASICTNRMKRFNASGLDIIIIPEIKTSIDLVT